MNLPEEEMERKMKSRERYWKNASSQQIAKFIDEHAYEPSLSISNLQKYATVQYISLDWHLAVVHAQPIKNSVDLL